MKKLLIITLSIVIFAGPAWGEDVFYCEYTSAVFTQEHNVYQSAILGKKFKMMIDYPKVKFTKWGPSHDDIEIQDTWGGHLRKFIARNIYKTDTVVLFDEGYLIISSHNDLARFGGTSTASCEKF